MERRRDKQLVALAELCKEIDAERNAHRSRTEPIQKQRYADLQRYMEENDISAYSDDMFRIVRSETVKVKITEVKEGEREQSSAEIAGGVESNNVAQVRPTVEQTEEP